MSRRILLIDIGSGLTLAGVLPSVALYGTYSARLIAGGGQPPYTYTLDAGALPAGVYLDAATGAISGTPTEAGNFPITARATDLSGASVVRAFAVQVIAEPLTLSGAAPDGTVGVAQSYTYTVAGGVPPYTFALVDAPAGWSVPDASAPTIEYTAAAVGTSSWVIRCTDSAGTSFDLADAAVFVEGVNYDSVVLADSPYAYWEFGEAASPFYDQVGAYDLTWTGALSTHQANLVGSGYSISFDGSNALTCNSGAIGGNSAVSLEIVVKLTAVTALGYLMHMGDYNDSGGQGYAIYVLGGKVGVEFGSAGFTSLTTTSAVLAAGERAIIGISHDPVLDQVKVYKNGSLVQTFTWTSGLGATNSKMRIGGVTSTAGNNGPLGLMTRPAIYSSVLPASKFLSHAQAAGLA